MTSGLCGETLPCSNNQVEVLAMRAHPVGEIHCSASPLRVRHNAEGSALWVFDDAIWEKFTYGTLGIQ